MVALKHGEVDKAAKLTKLHFEGFTNLTMIPDSNLVTLTPNLYGGFHDALRVAGWNTDNFLLGALDWRYALEGGLGGVP